MLDAFPVGFVVVPDVPEYLYSLEIEESRSVTSRVDLESSGE